MRVQQGATDQLYSDPVVYTKKRLSTNLQTQYGTIAALNAAWGSNYTTFGSSATTVASETIGTGNGVTTTFNYTFAHTVVDPASILISVGGVAQAGDCPWFEYYCNRLNTSPNGTIMPASGNILSASSQVNYTTGVITLVFSSAPANGVAITASYQYSGWPKALAGGTGFLDEDGTSAWYPTSIPYPPVGTVASDLDAFYGQIVKQYFSTFTSAMRSFFPHHLVIGPDALCAKLEAPVLLQAAQYLDVFLANCTQPTYNNGGTGQNIATAAYNTMGIPIIPYNAIVTTSDSQWTWANCAATGWDDRCAATQQGRGQLYQSWAQQWFNNYIGADGYGFIVGWDWWQYTDNIGERQNFGLVSSNDNLYDGVQDTTTKVTDSLGFVTIPEPGNYGDFLSPVKASNRIWLGP